LTIDFVKARIKNIITQIENFWNEIKVYLRKLKVEVKEKLVNGINLAIQSVLKKILLNIFDMSDIYLSKIRLL